jgi:hypothetical protein
MPWFFYVPCIKIGVGSKSGSNHKNHYLHLYKILGHEMRQSETGRRNEDYYWIGTGEKDNVNKNQIKVNKVGHKSKWCTKKQ